MGIFLCLFGMLNQGTKHGRAWDLFSWLIYAFVSFVVTYTRVTTYKLDSN